MLLVSVDPSETPVNSLSFLTSSVSSSVELLHSPTHTHTQGGRVHQDRVSVQIRECEVISSTCTVRQQWFQHAGVPAQEGVDVRETDGHFG